MEELEARVRLSRRFGFDSGPLARLLREHGSAVAALAAAETARLPLPAPAATAADDADPETLIGRDLAWLGASTGRGVLALGDPTYPDLLARIPDPPPLLYYVGDPEVLGQTQLAVVGSRNPTPAGRITATSFARYLVGQGLVITSGLARGIDAAAHEGALKGQGFTVAVLGTGVDRVYPSSNRALAHRIAESGIIVSEFPLGTPARPPHFPRRNRIISGLAIGTLVVEAARRSGSLITARLAAEQGREVFAIPGSIQNPMARGCHALIRQGAKLVETAADILEELPPLLGVSQMPGVAAAETGAEDDGGGLDPDYRELLAAMGYDPVSVDELVERTALTANVLSSMLLVLELEGHVSPVAGGQYARIPKEANP